jgi:hypothetical protein
MILLQDLANMAGKPPAEGISGFIRKNGLVSPDGEDDGRLFVSRNGCGSDGYRAFATRLGSLIMRRSEREPAPLDEPIFAMLASPEFRARNNIPDPTAELARRKSAALKKSAQASCEKSFDRPGFCACAMKGLDAAGIGDANWQTLGRSFHSIGTLGAQRADLMNAVRGCYRPPG